MGNAIGGAMPCGMQGAMPGAMAAGMASGVSGAMPGAMPGVVSSGPSVVLPPNPPSVVLPPGTPSVVLPPNATSMQHTMPAMMPGVVSGPMFGTPQGLGTMPAAMTSFAAAGLTAPGSMPPEPVVPASSSTSRKKPEDKLDEEVSKLSAFFEIDNACAKKLNAEIQKRPDTKAA